MKNVNEPEKKYLGHFRVCIHMYTYAFIWLKYIALGLGTKLVFYVTIVHIKHWNNLASMPLYH